MRKNLFFITVAALFFAAGCSDTQNNTILYLADVSGSVLQSDMISFEIEPVEQLSRTIFPESIDSVIENSTDLKLTFTFNTKDENNEFKTDVSKKNNRLMLKDTIPVKYSNYFTDVTISFTASHSGVKVEGCIENADISKSKLFKMPVNYVIESDSNPGAVNLSYKLNDGWNFTGNNFGSLSSYLVPYGETDLTNKKDLTATYDSSNKTITINSNLVDYEISAGYYQLVFVINGYKLIDNTVVNKFVVPLEEDVVFVVNGKITEKKDISLDFMMPFTYRNYFISNNFIDTGDGFTVKTPCYVWSLFPKLLESVQTGNGSSVVTNLIGELSLFNVSSYNTVAIEKSHAAIEQTIRFVNASGAPEFVKTADSYYLKFTDEIRLCADAQGNLSYLNVVDVMPHSSSGEAVKILIWYTDGVAAFPQMNIKSGGLYTDLIVSLEHKNLVPLYNLKSDAVNDVSELTDAQIKAKYLARTENTETTVKFKYYDDNEYTAESELSYRNIEGEGIFWFLFQ